MTGFVYSTAAPSGASPVGRWLIIGFTGAVVIGAAATIWSIVLRRAVEERTREYRESERRLIEAQAIGHVGDWQLDLATGQTHWSHEVYRIMERDPALGPSSGEEALSKYSPEEQARLEDAVRRARELGQTTQLDASARLPSGRILHQTSVIAPVRDDEGRVVRIVGTVQDITARKEAEATVAASEARFRTLIDHAPDAIVTLDIETGKFIDANPRACELYGLPREVLLTKNPVELSPPLQPDGRPSAESAAQKIEAALAGRTSTFRWDHVRPDGTIVPCEIRLVRLPSEDHPLIRGSITDITDRLRAEEALKTRSAELERSNKELERFAYVASHDLQEPLRMVTSFTQLLAKRYAGKLGTDADEFIGFAVDGAKRMQMLIDDLLTYSRAGKLPVKLARFPADSALDTALSNLQSGIESSRAAITRDPLPTITADQTQLVQLFQNLIGNALKFRREEPLAVHISARADNGHWVFCVQDNGIGIDSRHIGRLFVMFQRLHPRHEYPGSGIGLAVCKMIVERIGGRIWVESIPGQGSSFRFSVPVPPETRT
jgi:PAS domain S-box-containing protein